MNEESSAVSEINGEEFSIRRTFEVSKELMFQLWTERDHLQAWFGPKGTTIFRCENDLRVGGTMLYGMRSPDGSEHWGRWIYREITPSDRIVFVVSFSDENGGITRNPWNESWPLEILSTVTFDEEEGKTTVTVQWTPLDASENERDVFVKGADSMGQGWSGTFERLEEHLVTL